MIKIGDFSKLSNLSVKMLRHYDEIGLLTPNFIDINTNYRYYHADQLEVARRINVYKNSGFSLEDIQTLTQIESNDALFQVFYKKQKEILAVEQSLLNKKMTALEQTFLNEDTQQKNKYFVIEKTIPARHVISRRRTIASYENENELWDELYSEIKELNISPKYDGYTMAIYHDNEYFEREVDVEVQVTVEDNINHPSNIVSFKRTPPIHVASIIFSGSYEQMPYVTQYVGKWLSENNYELGGPMFNIFHISPAQSSNENDWVTEACFVLNNTIEER